MIQKKKKGKAAVNVFAGMGRPLTIGILSLSGGSGGMHLGLMLANYLTSKKRLKGVLVISDRHRFKQLLKRAGEEEELVIRGVSIQPFEQDEIAGIMNKGFDFVIFSLQNGKEDGWEEFLRCKRCYIVENFSEWKEEKMTGFVQENRKFSGFGQWRFFYAFGAGDYVKEIERRLRIPIKKIPWNQDAFLVLRDSFSFLESLV